MTTHSHSTAVDGGQPSNEARPLDLGDALENLFRDMLPEFRQRFRVVEDFCSEVIRLAEVPLDGRAAAIEAAHKLAGTLGTFAMSDGSDAALFIEQLLIVGGYLPRAELAELDDALETISESLERRVALSSAVLVQDDDQVRGAQFYLSFAGAQRTLRQRIAWEAASFGGEELTPELTLLPKIPAVCIIDAWGLSAVDVAVAIGHANNAQQKAVVVGHDHNINEQLGYAKLGAVGVIADDQEAIDIVRFIVQRLGIGVGYSAVVGWVGNVPAGCVDDLVSRGWSVQRFSSVVDAITLRTSPPPVLVWNPVDAEPRDIAALELLRTIPSWASTRVLHCGDVPDKHARLFDGRGENIEELADHLVRRGNTTCLRQVQPLDAYVENRALLAEAAQSAIEASGRCSVVRVGLANLAEINIWFGMEAGARSMQRVHNELRIHLGGASVVQQWSSDVLVGIVDEDEDTVSEALAEVSALLGSADLDIAGEVSELLSVRDLVAIVESGGYHTMPTSSALAGLPMGLAGRSLKALLIEDDPIVSAIVEATLEDAGYGVTVVNTGLDAARALTRHDVADRYDLAIVDIGLPEMDGVSVLRTTRSKMLGLPIPVVLLTARTGDSADVSEGLRLGAVDYVQKPFNPSVLLRRVQQAVGT